MRTSEQTKEYITALNKFQGEITPPPKSRTVTVKQRDGGTYSYSYAELDTILEHIKVSFNANGFSWYSGINYPANGAPVLTTRVNHTSGQWLETDYRLPNTNDPKAFAGEVTYGRRYCFSMLMGLSSQQDADELPPPPRPQNNNANQNRQGQGQRPQGQPQQRGPQGHAGQPIGQPATGAAGSTPSAPAAPNQPAQPAQLGEPSAPAVSPTTQQNGLPASAPSAGPSNGTSMPTLNGQPQPLKPIGQTDWDALVALVGDQTRFNPWNMDQLGEYMRTKYQRARLGQYSRDEYEELMEAVRCLSFSQAMELAYAQNIEQGKAQ